MCVRVAVRGLTTADQARRYPVGRLPVTVARPDTVEARCKGMLLDPHD